MSGRWCGSRPFGRFSYDPGKARSLLQQAGYDCSTRICKKDGHTLRLSFTTDAISSALTSSQEIIASGARAAGVDLQVKNLAVGPLGSLGCPIGRRNSGPVQLCVMPVSVDPSVTDLLACDRIPTEANRFVGNNFISWCNPEADQLMKAADRELHPDRRLELMTRVYELEAEEAIGLPLFVRSALSVWRDDDLRGPIGLWSGTPYGLFFNMNEWYLVR